MSAHDDIAERDFPEDAEIPKVEIHATDVCNNRCTFCTTGWVNLEQSDSIQHPPREMLRKKLEEAYAQGARRVLFQGGEPTVRRDLGDLLKDAHDIGYQVSTIFTNARMAASKAGARWMVDMNVTWFQVSIQGGVAAAHDASVAVKGAFDQTVAGTRRLIEMGQRVKINSVLTVHLLDSLDEYAALMVDLMPEEVGMDTIKPAGAFAPSRESYERLAPRMSLYSDSLRRAMERMNAAGIRARMTSFPPCLIPGGEQFVSEEPGSTISQHWGGSLMNKQTWKRGMQVKAACCRDCAYDDVCGGLYQPYVDVHGVGELHALSARKAAPGRPKPPPLVETPLTDALRALFVTSSRPEIGALSVSPTTDGGHVLLCHGTLGRLRVYVDPKSGGRAYAVTDRFAVSYRPFSGDGEGEGHTPPPLRDGRPDLRLVDEVVRVLRAAEPTLAASAAPLT